MPSTISFSQGDVVLVPFPFTDLSATKQRPALVLSPERLNKLRPDLVLAAITSQVPADSWVPDYFFFETPSLPALRRRHPRLLRYPTTSK
jgi:PemK-like, MazF-like toxin of type II toxin-antitoxin system